MKLFTLLLLVVTSSAGAQTWISSNAVWHYDYADYSGTGIEGFVRYSYTADTVVGGMNCQRIDGKAYEFNTWPQVEFADSMDYPSHFTRVSNDTVYYWDNGQFFVLYDFGADIGDTWVISVTNNGWSNCEDTSRVEVTDTGSVMLNGMSYRTITLQPVDGSSYGLSGLFVERFGLLVSDEPWHLFPRLMICDSATIAEWYHLTFKCFEDDNFSLYNPSGIDCEYLLTHLDIETNSGIDFEVFPNPASQNVHIISGEPGMLRVFSLAGREVAHFITDGDTDINLSGLDAGIYILELNGVSGGTVLYRLVKE